MRGSRAIPVPTPRLALLVLCAAIVFGAASLAHAILPVALLALAACLLATSIDAVLVARTGKVVAIRVAGPVLSHGGANLVCVDIRNDGARAARSSFVDVWPTAFSPDRFPMRARIPPGSSIRLSYHVTPSRRGAFRVPASDLRIEGPLGLVALHRRGVVPESEVRVYPALAEVARYDLAARRSLRAEIGVRAVRALGPGTEIEALREYTPDDEFRRVDWKATARRGIPMTRDLRDERSQQLTILVDAGRLGAAELGASRRIDHAVNAALLLAHVASVRGDRVGLLVFDRQVRRWMAPKRASKATVPLFARALYDVDAQPVEPEYEAAFRFLASHDRRRSLLVVFTDVLSPEASEPLVSHLSATVGRHLPLCVTIADPALLEATRTPVEDPASVYRLAAAREIWAERDEALRRMRARGVLTLDAPPASLTPTVVARYLELKARRLL